MSESKIKCPGCGMEIEITEALTGPIESGIRRKYEAAAAARDKDYQARLAEVERQAKELEARRLAADEQMAEKLKGERLKLAEQKKTLETQQQQMEEQVAEKLKAERKMLVEAERKKILAEQSEQTRALETELAEKNQKLAEANKKELEFLKKQRELEQARETIDLEVQRKIAEERKKIAEEATQKASEEQMLKMREKDDQLTAMKKQIDDLKRRAEQGSQEAQGEALEGALQDSLQAAFPFDRFEEVKKGQRGGDLVQYVRNGSGRECGAILWETKYTKAWAGAWLEKLKKDQQEAGAAVAALATMVLPKEVENFAWLDGVWVTNYGSARGLAMALRMGLIQAARERTLSANQETVKDVIYRYVTGQEFAMSVRAVADAFKIMKEDLDREKRAMEKIWKSREKQIETVLGNVDGIEGALQGYLGARALPETGLKMLEGMREGGEGESLSDNRN